ncbi:MAG: hypothetical protein QFX32_02565 [Methanolinea sp.]|nr:hypothetical protein [Methanolinea sp.]
MTNTMRRAGYLCRNGYRVLDGEGVPREVALLYIHGARLCIPVDDLSAILEQGATVTVWKVKQNWMEYLGGEAGKAAPSRSGKALNITLGNGDRFTVSLESLRDVLSSRERVAPVVELPEERGIGQPRNHVLWDFAKVPSPCPA